LPKKKEHSAEKKQFEKFKVGLEKPEGTRYKTAKEVPKFQAGSEMTELKEDESGFYGTYKPSKSVRATRELERLEEKREPEPEKVGLGERMAGIGEGIKGGISKAALMVGDIRKKYGERKGKKKATQGEKIVNTGTDEKGRKFGMTASGKIIPLGE